MTREEALSTLGLASDFDQDALRRGYASALKRHRPDRDPEGFQRVRAAFELLESVPVDGAVAARVQVSVALPTAAAPVELRPSPEARAVPPHIVAALKARRVSDAQDVVVALGTRWPVALDPDVIVYIGACLQGGRPLEGHTLLGRLDALLQGPERTAVPARYDVRLRAGQLHRALAASKASGRPVDFAWLTGSSAAPATAGPGRLGLLDLLKFLGAIAFLVAGVYVFYKHYFAPRALRPDLNQIQNAICDESEDAPACAAFGRLRKSLVMDSCQDAARTLAAERENVLTHARGAEALGAMQGLVDRHCERR